jgi:corrinoid protein of di/trimethylamine methyltransferase
VEILEEIDNVVVEGDKERLIVMANKALAQNVDPMEIIEKGFTRGMHIVGDKFEKMEIYLPEMLLCAESTKAAIDVIKPHIKEESVQQEGVVVIGTIQGDVHDIGKSIVAFYLEVSGFKVYDLGKDVPPSVFVDEAEAKGAAIIGVSALLTSTMAYIPDVIDELKRRGLREKYKVMVGGGASTPQWATEIGADGYGADFAEAAKVAKELIKARKVASK